MNVANVTGSDTASYVAPYDPVPPGEPKIVFQVIPNPFTPNEDGFNDRAEFRQGDETPDYWVITIMDRTGRIVKTLAHGDYFWDGTDESGRLMRPGSYLFAVSEGDSLIHRGVVTLIR